MAVEFALIPDSLPKILLSPDMKKIQQFPEGNLGIADGIKKSFNLKALSSIKDLEALKTYVQKGGVTLPSDFNSYVQNGKLKINLSDIDFNPSQNFNGLKSLEMTTIKSIFETQKPYMEIIGIVSKSLVDVEDIIARTLALAESSLKPKYNEKALGFQFKLFKSDNNKIQNINSDKNKNSSSSNNPSNNSSNNGTNIGITASITTDYEIVSVEYSTGEKKDNVSYNTVYRDIKESKLVLDDSDITENEYIQPKPDVIAFGICAGSGLSINPPEWLQKSGKWYGQFPQLQGYSYIWKKGDNTLVSAGEPDHDTYGGGWDNTGEKVFNNNDKQLYSNFFNFKLEDRLANTNTTEDVKSEIRSVVQKAIDPQGQLVSISDGGFLSEFNPRTFTTSNASYMPKQIRADGKYLWIDPETEYDLKLIKIDSTLDIAFFTDIGERVETRIQRFLTNTYELKYEDNAPFDFEFLNANAEDVRNGLSGSNIVASASYYNVTTSSFDNVVSDKEYQINVVRRTSPSNFTPIFWEGGIIETQTKSDRPNDSKYTLYYPDFVNPPIVATPSPPKTDGSAASAVSNLVGAVVGAVSNTVNAVSSAVSQATSTYHYVYKKDEDWIYGVYDAKTDGVNIKINLNDIGSAKPVKDGDYSIPLYGTIRVRDGKIYGWPNAIDTFKVSDGQKVSTVINSLNTEYNTSVDILAEGSIRVSSEQSEFGLIINAKQIRNDHLQISDTYGDKLKYGTQDITRLFRYRTSLIDTQTWYILEGFDVDKYLDSIAGAQGTQVSSLSGSGYYKKRHALGAAGVFVGILVKILTKLIPKIKTLLELFKNPAKFITDPIIEKLGENFEIFDPNIISDFNAVKSSIPTERFDQVKNNYQLFKYVDVDKLTGDMRHILDGRATTKLFGIEFGLELKDLILKLIFKNDNKDLLKQFQSVFENHGLNGNKDINSLFDLGPSTSETYVNTYNGVTTREEVDVVYSTGTKKDGIDYKYIYVTKYVQDLILKYEEFNNAGDYDNALDALERALEADPRNDFIKGLIDKLQNKLRSLLNPLLKLILELVTMPAKLVKGIIEFIMDLFKSLNISNIKDKMQDFMSFKWLLDMMKPDTLLGFIGLKIDIGLLNKWKLEYKQYPDDFIFDLSKVLTIPLFAKLPKVDKTIFPHMMNLLCDTINSMLLLIQGIINSIIDLIWSLVSLDALIPQPYLNITIPCAKNNKYSITQLFDILNANGNGSGGGGKNGLFDFLYDVRLPDGRSIQDLDRNKLDEFIKENGDLEFTFNF